MLVDAEHAKSIIPVSAVMATKDRAHMVRRTVLDMANQSYLPAELIIVDASSDELTKQVCQDILNKLNFKIIYVKAIKSGAATQRMQGVDMTTQTTIWFLDDDILMQPECVQRLWNGFHVQENVGAVNAMITNQRYTSPGLLTRSMYKLMHGEKLASYAGKVIGPAWNLLPEDEEGMPDYVSCEWLNTTCTMYRKSSLPTPVFSEHFQDYSLMEDVALSLLIARKAKLLNARTARIFHDSQPGIHKNNKRVISEMQLINRHYVMTQIMKRTSLKYYVKLFVFEVFGITTSLRIIKNILSLPAVLMGKITGVYKIMTS